MTKAEARTRVAKLSAEIERHRYLYHVLDRQEISDAALDSLKRELAKLERQFPDLVMPDSPTQRVGGEPRAEFREIRRTAPMLSLDDVFTGDELRGWGKRNRAIAPNGRYAYVCELKVDGLAVELTYADHVLVEASTRGDGMTGEDVTANVKTIESIPLRLRAEAPRALVARGEIYMSKEQFARLNDAQARAGLPPFANPRNIAAGSIRQLDSKVTAARQLDCFIYDLVSDEAFPTHHEEHDAARNWGFKTNPHTTVCATLEDVIVYHDHWAARRDRLPYWVDGIVVTVDDNKTFRRLGVAGKAPRGALAFKFPAAEATTTVEDIIVQVGRTGALTPIAVLKPVSVSGTTVSRATLHNEQETRRKDVRVGDTVIVRKAGDIIPEVVRVLPRLRLKGTQAFRMPTRCPICGARVARNADGAIARCGNRSCAAVAERRLRHFVSRAAADIEGVGPKLIRKLLEAGLVRDAADLYRLRREDIAFLERYAEKSAENILASINGRRTLPLGRFVYALGILHVGSVTANDLAEKFGSLEQIRKATREDLMAIAGVGDVVGESVFAYFREAKTERLLNKFRLLGVRVQNVPRTRRGPFAGKNVVVTGSLGKLTREEAWEHIRRLGGTVRESVGQSTGLLIVGDDPGSKVERARARGIPLMSQDEFLRICLG